LRSELTIHDGLADNLRKDLFATPRTYRCWVRFSDPGSYVEPDISSRHMTFTLSRWLKHDRSWRQGDLAGGVRGLRLSADSVEKLFFSR